MLLRRVLCTTIVLFSLALLDWPQFAHTVVIVKDDSNLTAIDHSIAIYNVSSRELRITGGSPFKVTLAASDPTLSIDVELVADVAANNSTHGPPSGGDNNGTALNAAVIGGIIGGVLVFLIVIVAVVLAIVFVLRRRAQKAKSIAVEEQLQPGDQPAVENEPDDARRMATGPGRSQRGDGMVGAQGEKQQMQDALQPRVIRQAGMEVPSFICVLTLSLPPVSNAKLGKNEEPTLNERDARSDWSSGRWKQEGAKSKKEKEGKNSAKEKPKPPSKEDRQMPNPGEKDAKSKADEKKVPQQTCASKLADDGAKKITSKPDEDANKAKG